MADQEPKSGKGQSEQQAPTQGEPNPASSPEELKKPRVPNPVVHIRGY